MAMRSAAACLLAAACGVAMGGATAEGEAAVAADQAAASCGNAEECAIKHPPGASEGGELNSFLQTSTAALQSGLSGAASRGITEIQTNYIVVNGRGYSRYNAHAALLGSFGPEFVNTANIPPKLEFTEGPDNDWLGTNVKFGTSVWVKSQQESSFDVDFSTNAIPAVDIEASLSGNQSHSGEFYLMQLTFASQFDLIQEMNLPKYKAKREYMKNHMSRPRIVTSVWILIEGDEEHSNFCMGGSLKLTVEKIGKIAVSASGCRMSTWRFSPDSVMAYETGKIKFDKKGNVEYLEPDRATR